jgi:hypothetical protein
VRGPAVERIPFAAVSGIGFESELGSDQHLATKRSQRFAHHFLIHQRTIDLSRIEKGNASLDRGANDPDCLFFLRHRTIAEAQTHAAKAQC